MAKHESTNQYLVPSGRKFNLRKYFSVLSITVIIILTVILSGIVYLNQRQSLVEYSITYAANLASNLNQQVHEHLILPNLNKEGALTVINDPERYKIIKTISDGFRHDYPDVVKYKVFNLKGEVIYSSEYEDIGKVSSTGALQAAFGGETGSKLTRRETPFPPESSQAGKTYNMDLLEVYVPIYRDHSAFMQSNIIGAFEIYKDVTPLFSMMRKEFYKIPLLLVFAMGVLYLLLQIIIRKADKIIREQNEEIDRYNNELEQAQNSIRAAIDEVIEHESFHVRYEREHDTLLQCWEVKKCDKASCPSYMSEDLRCWQSAGTFCGGEVQGQFANKFGDCRKCEVYQHAFKNNINVIGETFNNMMTLLQSKHSQLEEMNKRLNVLIDTDPLTEISNRRSLQKRIEKIHLMSLRYNHPYSIIICDIDNFKLYNDTYGHQQGDYVLVSIANAMKSAVRRTDEIFRWGGEEFIIILPEQNHVDALKVAENLRSSICSLKIKHEKSSMQLVTISCGVASFYPWKTRDTAWEAVIKQADDALYRAKTGKKNSVYSAAGNA